MTLQVQCPACRLPILSSTCEGRAKAFLASAQTDHHRCTGEACMNWRPIWEEAVTPPSRMNLARETATTGDAPKRPARTRPPRLPQSNDSSRQAPGGKPPARQADAKPRGSAGRRRGSGGDAAPSLASVWLGLTELPERRPPRRRGSSPASPAIHAAPADQETPEAPRYRRGLDLLEALQPSRNTPTRNSLARSSRPPCAQCSARLSIRAGRARVRRLFARLFGGRV